MLYFAIIPARGGSKGLPGKNIRPLGGIPLVMHSVEAAVKANVFTKVIVTTDCSEIIGRIVPDEHVEVVKRPAELATDDASTIDAVLHAFEAISDNDAEKIFVVLLQPTSPLRTEKHILESISLFEKETMTNSLISVAEVRHHPYKTVRINSDGFLTPFQDAESLSMPRQRLPLIYDQNGAIYISKLSNLRSQKTFFIEPVQPYVMSFESSVDIDSQLDFVTCEILLEKQSNGRV